MAKAINTLHVLKVRNSAGKVLTMQFVDRDIRDSVAAACERAGGEVIECHRFGTAIERTEAEAIETAQFWLGLLPKAN